MPLTNVDANISVTSLISANGMHERGTRLMLDRANRIAFASSNIEHWLGRDYESVIGLHIASLLPELLARIGDSKPHKARMRELQQMGWFTTYANHADGSRIPAVVSFQNGVWGSAFSLLLLNPGR